MKEVRCEFAPEPAKFNRTIDLQVALQHGPFSYNSQLFKGR
uniref:Uncharacterized protein n=1 Tax=Rhizobium rhizogenes TaxID=359 RepID=A0A7S5DS33_RHIRH|nr:hypothetical protein pC5.7d_666 [Rhizobium rhizogenes]